MTTYLIDSNVFIQAKNLHYGFDFCPAFWDWLVEKNVAGKVASIEKVADELRAGDDDLAISEHVFCIRGHGTGIGIIIDQELPGLIKSGWDSWSLDEA